MTDENQRYIVHCRDCESSYDAVAANFCTCISKEPTIECPSCGKCFCEAPSQNKLTFWMNAPSTLWQRKGASRGAGAAYQNPDVDSVARPMVLLVEDEADLAAIARTIILEMGFGLAVAADGNEGLDLARRYKPELVLTDALMPGMDGRELCRVIKDDPTLGPATKVILMTSLYTSGKYRREGLTTFKADEYLSKPIEREQLQDLLRKLTT